MKELSTEQKARAYDEAIKKARNIVNSINVGLIGKDSFEAVFPELRESEDERIRKLLLEAVTQVLQDQYCYNRGVSKEKVVAWLEKQCRNPYSGVSFEYNDNVWGMCARDNGVDILFNKKLIQHISGEKQGEQKDILEDAILDSNEDGLIAETIRYKNEKKLVDKVEPKFHEGDWIVFNGLTIQVKRVVKGFYITTSKDGITNGYGWDIDNAARLWTIQEAKDGDVLVLNNEVFIYAHRKQMYSIAVAHCFVDNAGSFYLDGEFGYKEYGKTISPATKEQRDLLFKKMKEKGYKWDAEKKELKKIEHKPAEWHREDEQNLNACLGYIPDEFLRRWLQDIIHAKYDKTIWSKEDEKYSSYICAALDCYYRLRKDRSNTNGQEDLDKARNWLYNKLKSLRSGSHWKPSDEQMENLSRAFNSGTFRTSLLMSLYQDLKKLREE